MELISPIQSVESLSMSICTNKSEDPGESFIVNLFYFKIKPEMSAQTKRSGLWCPVY